MARLLAIISHYFHDPCFGDFFLPFSRTLFSLVSRISVLCRMTQLQNGNSSIGSAFLTRLTHAFIRSNSPIPICFLFSSLFFVHLLKINQ